MNGSVALEASTWEALEKARHRWIQFMLGCHRPQVEAEIWRRGGTLGFLGCYPPPVVRSEPGLKSGRLEKETIGSRSWAQDVECDRAE